MTMTTRSSRRVNPSARNPNPLALALSGPFGTGMLIDTAPIFIPHCTQSSRPAKVVEHRMILDVILDVILHGILHGFGAFNRGSIRPWDRIVGIGSIMSERTPGVSRVTRYIVGKQPVSTPTATTPPVPPLTRLP